MKKLMTLACTLSSTFMFAQESAAAGRQQAGPQTFIMIGVALVLFYLILWRPEQKRRKSMETKRNSIEKGSRVTVMGIVGTVYKVEENTVILNTYNDTKIEVLKGAITDVEIKSQSSECCKAK